MMIKRWSGQGMALVEIIVSIMFLMIAVSGFMGTYSYLADRSVKIRNKRMALRLAQKRLEACLAEPNLFTMNSGTQDISVDKDRGLDGQLKTIIDSTRHTIECRIIWNDGNVSLTTIRAK